MYRCVLLLALYFMANTVNGLNDMSQMSQMVVKREGSNDADCQKACKSETLIKCQFYKFVESSKTCLLSESDHPMGGESNPSPSGFDSESLKKYLYEKRALEKNGLGQIKSLKGQLNDLEFKVKNFRQMKTDMEKTLQEIEVRNAREEESKHVYLQMKAKMEKLTQVSLMMQNEISQLVHHRSNNNRDLKLLRQAKQKSDLDLETMSNNMEKLQSYLATVRKEDDKNKNELVAMKESQDQMTELMRVLTRKVHSTKAELKSNPLIMKILNNQKMLADGLQDMENKLTTFDKKQVKSDSTYDELYGRVISDEGERKSLSNSLSSLQKRMGTLQDDIKRIDNPQASGNMEKLRTLTTLKNDVAFLKRSSEEMEKNMKNSHNELENLIKDIVNVKLSDQSNKAGITAVALAHRHTQQIFDGMRKEQNNAFNKIRVLEDVYKRILEVVHNIEVHQVQLKQDISHFDDSINIIGENLNRKLDETQGESLANRASSLGVALDKLTSESVSSLSRENLTPIENEGEANEAEGKEQPSINGNKPKPIKEIEKNVNSFLKNKANGNKLAYKVDNMKSILKEKEDEKKLVDKVEKVLNVEHSLNEAEKQGKPIPNSLSEKIQIVRENITRQLKPGDAEEIMVQQLAQEILGPTTESVIKNKVLKKELAKRKSTLESVKEESSHNMPSAALNMKEKTPKNKHTLGLNIKEKNPVKKPFVSSAKEKTPKNKHFAGLNKEKNPTKKLVNSK